MAEYIERDAVFKIVADMMCDCKVRHKGRAINRNIKQLPTADFVTVVRCKDCKYYYRADKDTCLCTHKKNLTFKTALTISREHYCSYGERRLNDD